MCCRSDNIITVTHVFMCLTEDRCSHPPIALTVCIFNKINSYSAITESRIEVDGRDWAEGVFGALATCWSIALVGRSFYRKRNN